MSKVKKNIRLCAISTDFSELGGYNAQFVGEQDVKDARDFTAEVIDELGIVANPGSILAPFEKATFTVRSRAGNPEGQPQEKEISAAVKYAGPVPIAQSADGLIKVWKIEPTEGEKITLGKNTKVTGEMLGYDSETGEGIMGVHLIFPGGISYECGMDTIPPESTELILKPGEIPEGLEPGDYKVEMQLERVRDFAFAEMITVHNLPVTVEAE